MEDIVAKLTRELGPDAVVTGDEVRTRSTGWMRPGPNLAKALVRPRSTEEVSKILRICHEAHQPVVPQGGLTGLVGGARSRVQLLRQPSAEAQTAGLRKVARELDVERVVEGVAAQPVAFGPFVEHRLPHAAHHLQHEHRLELLRELRDPGALAHRIGVRTQVDRLVQVDGEGVRFRHRLSSGYARPTSGCGPLR